MGSDDVHLRQGAEPRAEGRGRGRGLARRWRHFSACLAAVSSQSRSPVRRAEQRKRVSPSEAMVGIPGASQCKKLSTLLYPLLDRPPRGRFAPRRGFPHLVPSLFRCMPARKFTQFASLVRFGRVCCRAAHGARCGHSSLALPAPHPSRLSPLPFTGADSFSPICSPGLRFLPPRFCSHIALVSTSLRTSPSRIFPLPPPSSPPLIPSACGPFTGSSVLLIRQCCRALLQVCGSLSSPFLLHLSSSASVFL